MSQLKDTLEDCEARIHRAQADGDRARVLAILAEYRETVRQMEGCADEIKNELRGTHRGMSRVARNLLLAAGWTHANEVFIDELCELLAIDDPDFPSEVIVDILCKVPSAKAVPSLKAALHRKYNYDVYDEFGAKCLEALAAVDTDEAWEGVEAALVSQSERIRERAKQLIKSRRS